MDGYRNFSYMLYGRGVNTPTPTHTHTMKSTRQGKKFFGDGIAFWITQQPFWQEGDLHGNNHNFVGAFFLGVQFV